MNQREAKRRCWRIAARILERGDEPEALYIGGSDIHGYCERSVADYGRMRKAWEAIIDECWRKAGDPDNNNRKPTCSNA